MRTKTQIEEDLERHDSKWWWGLPQGKINEYKCSTCQSIIVTQDIDRGVTPAFKSCLWCPGTMYSSFYRVSQTLTPSYVWYRPDGKELKKLLKNSSTKDYVLRGGLMLKEAPSEATFDSKFTADA